jgi:hypothetical protein
VNSDLSNIERGSIPDALGCGGGSPSQDVMVYSNGTHLQGSGAANPAGDSITFPLDLDIPWDYLWDDMIEPWPVM